jgi:tRNA dimethylallyltransferase
VKKNMRQSTVICVMGPTAVGKSECAMYLTRLFPSEIVSVDSAAIYRDMVVGTAMPDTEQLKQVPHHLLHFLDPSESYSAAQFCHDAALCMNEICNVNKIPVLVGGTFLYFRSLLYGLSPLPPSDPAIRQHILQQAEALGWQSCHDKLRHVDPSAAKRIHPNDRQRIQRALEIYAVTGKTSTALFSTQDKGLVQHKIISIGLEPPDREWLHQRIKERFYVMLDKGFIEEVRQLYQRGDLNLNMPAMRAVGYRQVWQYLDGAFNYDEMCERCIAATRQLAKRQLTWLRSWTNIHRFNCQDPQLFAKIGALVEEIE